MWGALCIMGFFLMVGSYERWLRLDPEAPWAAGYLCIGSGEPAEPMNAGTVLSTRMRYLPLDSISDSVIKGAEVSLPGRGPVLRARLRRKLIELPVGEMGFLVGWLREGRMPEPGRDEMLGGSDWKLDEEVNVAGRTLRTVGVVVPSVSLFADSALVPADRTTEPVFAGDGLDFSPVRIIRLSGPELRDRKIHEQIQKAFPPSKFACLTAEVSSGATGYFAYLGGQTLFLIGGTGLFIAFYRWLARRIRSSILAEPLAEIVGRPRLFWGTHIAYFGLYILAAVLVHENRALHGILMSGVQQAFSSEGPLGVAGKAYLSGSIIRAAGVTFAVNLFLGALLVITFPSMILPGSGALVAALRATLWGLLLGPASVNLALMMIPHSGTLLLEGEGYILATFFALLIPIRLFGPGRSTLKTYEPGEWGLEEETPAPAESTLIGRYGRAVLLNVNAIVLVAAVLAVAALYEAVEVIWMAGL
jgi:hypothetical protein